MPSTSYENEIEISSAEIAVRCPYYSLVPKERQANLAFRRRMVELGNESPEMARQLWLMSQADILFFLNTFGWVYEPRASVVLPAITYPFQDQAILTIDECIGKEDLCIKKSRDMTATWDCCMVFEWRWQFRPLQSFFLTSRTEDLVDKADDPLALFWKMTFLLENQPSWLKPNIDKAHLKLLNVDNKSITTGGATTGNVGRGGRYTSFMLDEFAAFPILDGHKALYASQAATNGRLFNSTPQGLANAYYTVAHDPHIRKLVLHWSKHPDKRRGLYTSQNGILRIIDTDYKFPDDYVFILDGKLRSPWYDRECRRAIIPQLIAQELDMDFLGSGFQFFRREMLDEHLSLYKRAPFRSGKLEYDETNAKPKAFLDTPRGPLSLWIPLNALGEPPKGRYVIGVDISAGTGSSNSCLSIGDARLGKKVALFKTSRIMPHEMAKIAHALGLWFCDSSGRSAHIVPESNGGHNRQFIKCLVELGYRNIYRRRKEDEISPQITEKIGWGSTKNSKRELLEEYARALEGGDFMNPSESAIEEARQYVYLDNGGVAHAKSQYVTDPTESDENHGDEVIADALCWLGIKSHGFKWGAPKEPEIRPGCLAWVRQEREKALHAGALW